MKGFFKFLGIVAAVFGALAVFDSLFGKKVSGQKYLNFTDNSSETKENFEN